MYSNTPTFRLLCKQVALLRISKPETTARVSSSTQVVTASDPPTAAFDSMLEDVGTHTYSRLFASSNLRT